MKLLHPAPRSSLGIHPYSQYDYELCNLPSFCFVINYAAKGFVFLFAMNSAESIRAIVRLEGLGQLKKIQ
jgi:hypothetical protein